MNAAGGPWPGFAMEQIMKTMNMVRYHYHIIKMMTIFVNRITDDNENNEHGGISSVITQRDREQSNIA